MSSLIPDEILSLDLDVLNLEPHVKLLFVKLLNVIESHAKIIVEQAEEIQHLKDEIARLKGQKERPKFKSNVPNREKKEDFFKGEKSKEWKKKSKKPELEINKTEVIPYEGKLPKDAESKGHKKVLIQDIVILPFNTLYKLETFYSPSENKTYTAALPSHLKGTDFGPTLKTFIMLLHYVGRVTQNRIKALLDDFEIDISEGSISNILIKEKSKELSKERKSILKAGIKASKYLQADNSGARHKGKNCYVHVIDNELFSWFGIENKKDRKTIRKLFNLENDLLLVKILMTDDARQYQDITVLHILCWIHEIRHYLKLEPALKTNQKILENFMIKLKKYYHQLKKYRENPNEKQKLFIEQQFEELFSTKTDYDELDQRNKLTKRKKEKLLLVLEHPRLPLHNNASELAIREFVVKKKISNGTRSNEGKTALTNMLTIADTCRKQKTRFYKYLTNILTGQNQTTLAQLILKTPHPANY